MVALPLCITLFFTSLMNNGQPVDMPIGIVDQDNTTMSRKLTRTIDSFQSTHVVAHYPSVDDARVAMQRNEIYGFILFPEHFTRDVLSLRQPTMSFYYSNTSLTAGALVFKQMKTLCSLGMAGVMSSLMQGLGVPKQFIMPVLQPVVIDDHEIGNPWINYNMYLSNMIVPASFLLFVFLITAYSLGTELKFGTSKEWLEMAQGSIVKALLTKMVVHTMIYLVVFMIIFAYMFGYLHFPAPGGIGRLLLLAILSILAAQGFAIFIFGLMPSMRLAMSICSLWGVLSFSMVGSAFPVFAMDAPLQSAAWLFPMRHYYLFFQLCIFNDYPLADAAQHIVAMLVFATLPWLVMGRLKKAMLTYEYEP